MKRAYRNYVSWLTTTFQPSWINYGIELNTWLANCPQTWQGMVDLMNSVYDMLKVQQPSALVWPSFQMELLYVPFPNGFDQTAYNMLAGVKRDRFAMVMYPHAFDGSTGNLLRPSDLPADLLTRAASINNERVVIAETMWTSTPLWSNFTGQPCQERGNFSEAQSMEYIKFIISNIVSSKIDLVVWWSLWDLMPTSVPQTCYPPTSLCGSDYWCVLANGHSSPPYGDYLFKILGTGGLLDYTGHNSKASLYSQWSQIKGI
jgi:hypothetical protein